jgi:N-acetylmuramoyl-L-alanine amidase
MADPNQRSRNPNSRNPNMTAKGYPAAQRPASSNGAANRPAPKSAAPAGRPRPKAAAPANRPAPKAAALKRRSSRFVKAVLLILLCVSAGLVWHNMAFSGSKGIAAHVSDASSSQVNQHAAAPSNTEKVILHTEKVIPYAQMITYSSQTSKPLYGKVIILDPGHGGSDSGCIYPAADPQYFESVINLKIAESTKDALESQGATVIMLRTDDSWISLYRRIAVTHINCLQYANELSSTVISGSDQTRLINELSDTITINSDTVDSGGMGIMVGTGVGDDLKLLMNLEAGLKDVLFLSIHINSNPASSMHGTQVYYVTDESVIKSEKNIVAEDPSYSNNPNFPLRADYYGRDGSRNQNLAQALYDSIVNSAPQMKCNTQSILADNYAVLRENNLTGALIEVGFITNKKDRGYLTDDPSISLIAKGIAAGCVNFFADDA